MTSTFDQGPNPLFSIKELTEGLNLHETIPWRKCFNANHIQTKGNFLFCHRVKILKAVPMWLAFYHHFNESCWLLIEIQCVGSKDTISFIKTYNFFSKCVWLKLAIITTNNNNHKDQKSSLGPRMIDILGGSVWPLER